MDVRLPGTADCIYPYGLEQRLDAAITAQMERLMPTGDIARLRAATRLRCAGLALARSGADGAAAPIAEARRMVRQPGLTRAARLFGLSMQEPAEAFLAYRAGDHAGASRRMRATLDLLDRLADRYACDVTVRRAHIARNLLVTLRLAGDFVVAGRIAAGLLPWIAGIADWPLTAQARGAGRAILPDDEREAAVDQLVAELGRLALASPSTIRLPSLRHAGYPNTSMWRRVWSFLDLADAWQGHDAGARATAQARYLGFGCGSLLHMRRLAMELAGKEDVAQHGSLEAQS